MSSLSWGRENCSTDCWRVKFLLTSF